MTDTGQGDQTIIRDRYQAFPRTLCFITNGDDVLLLRGASDKTIWPNLYNGVGGHVEPEEDVRTAALREVEEETGLTVRDLRLRGVVNIPVDVEEKTGILMFVFTAAADSREVRPSDEGRPEWIPQDEVEALDLVEDLPILLPKVLSMAPDAPPFYGLYTYDGDGQLVASFS